MKPAKDFRATATGEETTRKTPKLNPLRKSGKERHTLYKSLDDDQEEDAELIAYRRQESTFDYMDDDEEETERG